MKKQSKPLNDAKILLWDIEATGLVADFSTILCIGWKWLHEDKVNLLTIDSYKEFEKDKTNDKPLIKDFLKIYNEADIQVTYNGTRYDVPMILSKTLEHGLEVPPNVPACDLYFTIKSNFKLSRKSLQNVGYYLDLSEEKTPVEGKIWRKAATGDKKSLQYIYTHCRQDVMVLQDLYLKVRPLIRRHPRVGKIQECASCGSTRLHRRGRALDTIAKKDRYRYQCQDCFHWSTRP